MTDGVASAGMVVRSKQRSAHRTAAAFLDRVEELGGVVLEPVWLGRDKRHRIRCPLGHEVAPRPGDVIRGGGLCRVCSRKDPGAAAAAFRVRVEELGGVVLEPVWLGSLRRHRVRCFAGHEVTALPADVQRGGGVCSICSHRSPANLARRAVSSAKAEARFNARLEELGAVLLEPRWLGSHVPHRVRCASGHECTPRPAGVSNGQGVCNVCAGNDPVMAYVAFCDRLEELGAVLLEPHWLGTEIPHRVRCPAGHECSPRPHNVMGGAGICRVCAGVDPGVAWEAFRARVEALGGVVLEPRWLGSSAPHRIRCSAGHEVTIHPGTLTKGGRCRVCAGVDPGVAWEAFRARVEALGGVVLERAPLGAHVPHRVRCAAGHAVTARPHSVQQGGGICRVCAGRGWDRFYVVMNRIAIRLKLGITSGDSLQRLRAHHKAGYRDVIRNFAVFNARELEVACLRTLELAGVRPVAGREYFDLTAALPVVLDVVDNWPGVADG